MVPSILILNFFNTIFFLIRKTQPGFFNTKFFNTDFFNTKARPKNFNPKSFLYEKLNSKDSGLKKLGWVFRIKKMVLKFLGLAFVFKNWVLKRFRVKNIGLSFDIKKISYEKNLVLKQCRP